MATRNSMSKQSFQQYIWDLYTKSKKYTYCNIQSIFHKFCQFLLNAFNLILTLDRYCIKTLCYCFKVERHLYFKYIYCRSSYKILITITKCYNHQNYNRPAKLLTASDSQVEKITLFQMIKLK